MVTETRSLYQFVSLVKLMRDAQVEYFERRTRAALLESKRLEVEVDREILRLESAHQ